jgi:uncharacterized protein (TIGR03000 family)
MYSVVLMAALAAGSSAPEFGHHGCHGCWGGCYGGYASCYGGYGGGWGHGHRWGGGCYGCYGYYTGWGCYGAGYGSCFGYYSGWTPAGCYGCYGTPYAAWGCYGNTYSIGGYGCGGYLGCYGGYSAYGVPPPVAGGMVVNPGSGYPSTRTPEMVPTPNPNPNPNGTNPVPDGTNPNPLPKKNPLKIEPEARGKVRFELPANARLFVDGVQIQTSSPTAVFQTPRLDPAKAYFYDVRVELDRDGQTLTDTQRIVVRPGREVTANFAALGDRAAALATAQRK